MDRCLITGGFTRVVRLVILVQRYVHHSFIVVVNDNADVNVSVVAVVEPSKRVITMQLAGVDPKLQMLVGKLQGSQTEYHRL